MSTNNERVKKSTVAVSEFNNNNSLTIATPTKASRSVSQRAVDESITTMQLKNTSNGSSDTALNSKNLTAAAASSLHALSFTTIRTHASCLTVAACTSSASLPPPSQHVASRVHTLYKRLRSHSHSNPSLTRLLELHLPIQGGDGVIVVEDTWSTSLSDVREEVGSSLTLLRSLTSSLLSAVTTLRQLDISHRFLHFEDIRLDTRAEWKLSGTFRRNIEWHGVDGSEEEEVKLDRFFPHPVFMPPELLLAGPACLTSTPSTAASHSQQHLFLRSDVYQLGILLLSLIRGSYPIDAQSAETIAERERLRNPNKDSPPSPSSPEPYQVDFGEVPTVAEAPSEKPTLTSFTPENMEELWKIYFDSMSGGGERKHPACQVCSPETWREEVSSNAVTSATITTPQLCMKCWLNVDNLEVTSSLPNTVASSLSLLHPSLTSASITTRSIHTSFLSLLRHLLQRDPVSRVTSVEAENHEFFRLTAKWRRGEEREKNVQRVWRKIEGGISTQMNHHALRHVTSLNSFHTQLNQISLDPFYRCSGFKSVPVELDSTVAHSNGDVNGHSLHSPRICQLCHQPLTPSHHPSSATSCHCLLEYDVDEVYQVWKATRTPVNVEEWMKEQKREMEMRSRGGGIEENDSNQPPHESRQNTLPRLLVHHRTLEQHFFDAGSPPIATLPDAKVYGELLPVRLSSPLSTTSSSITSSSYYLPLLPLYHIIKTSMSTQRQKELEKLWKELEVVDADLMAAGDDGSEEQQLKDQKRVVRNKPTAVAPLVEQSPSSSSSPLLISISSFVQLQNLFKLYPATRDDIIECVTRLVETYMSNDDGHTKQDKWKVYASISSSTLDSPYPSSLRSAVWPCLLSLNSSDFLSYTLAVECGVSLLTPHSSDAQISKDITRLIGYTKAQRRAIESMIRVYIRTSETNVYWQGMHEVAGKVFDIYCEEDDSAASNLSIAYSVFTAILSKLYLRALHSHDASSPALQHQLSHLTLLLHAVDPQLHSTLVDSLGLGLDMICTAWMLTGFSHVLPSAVWNRVWDALLTSGAATTSTPSSTSLTEYHTWLLLSVSALRMFRGVIHSASPSSAHTVLRTITHSLHTLDVREWMRMVAWCREKVESDMWLQLTM